MFADCITRLSFHRLFRHLCVSAARMRFEAFWLNFSSVLSWNFVFSFTKGKENCESSRLNLVKLSINLFQCKALHQLQFPWTGANALWKHACFKTCSFDMPALCDTGCIHFLESCCPPCFLSSLFLLLFLPLQALLVPASPGSPLPTPTTFCGGPAGFVVDCLISSLCFLFLACANGIISLCYHFCAGGS